MTTTESSQRTTLPDDEDVVFEVRDATVQFDMHRGVSRVLDEVDLDIRRDEILGVVGESGSGKSMFASALLDAVVDPGVLSGDITYRPPDGSPVNLLELSEEELREFRWEEVSMVFQGAMNSFNPVKKIRTHFEETLEAHNFQMAAGMNRARELLSDLYLDPDRVLDSYPHELSGGMKQRALIALSLVLEPNVLVMDEPTAALDLLMQRSIISLLDEIQEKYDLSLLFITHDLPLVGELCDRLAVMYAFEFVETGPTEEIIQNATHPYTRALLNTTPNIQTPVEEMRSIEGSSPDPVNTPSGCSYHPRCPLADEQCETEDPAMMEVGSDHATACWHWEHSEEAVPSTVDTADQTTEFDAATAASSGDRSGTPVLSLDDVHVHFDRDSGGFLSEPDTVKAVDGVSADLYENDVLVLVGESGCGKTTLGKTAIGLQRPTEGSVDYRGHDIWDVRDGDADGDVEFGDIRRALQLIHQDPGSSLNPNMTVLASLEEPLKKWESDLDANDRRGRIYRVLERVGMSPPEDYASRYPHQLSGGEKQRVALTRALLMNPDVILADEAVSALDVSLRVEMMDLMLELQDLFDTSYLVVSHNLSNARYIAQKAGGRIGIMYLGRLIEVGTPEQILRNPKHPYTKVLKWATPDLVPDAAKASRPPVRQIDIPDAVNPPSGCRFHTRCPEAREVCRREEPGLESGDDQQAAACFRQYDDHEYWDSDPLPEDAGADADAGAAAEQSD